MISHAEHLNTRKKLKEIPDIKTFEDILYSSTLSSEEKEILKQHYLEDKPLAYIGDMLGYSEITMIKKHKKILNKISKLI